MSNLLLEEKTGKIKDVYFSYVKIQRPTKKYQSEDTEYTVDVVVDKATFKEMKKKFPKNGAKEVDTQDFESAYKFPAPYPDQDEQYVLKFKSDSHYKDGTEKPYNYNSRPKVYQPSEKGVVDVTMDIRVGNGSFGDLAFSIRNNEYGQSHNLIGILVKNLIELEDRGNASPFGEVVNNEQEHEEDDGAPF